MVVITQISLLKTFCDIPENSCFDIPNLFGLKLYGSIFKIILLKIVDFLMHKVEAVNYCLCLCIPEF